MGPPRLPSRYRLVDALGRGAEGSVLLVEDLAVGGALRALKWVGSSLGAEAIDRLRNEFLTLARLAHPGLARVRDFGERDGIVYFTSDHVAGPTLLELETRAPEVLLDLLHQALCVLEYLHRRGVRHGDVKPQNLLVEPLRPERGSTGDASARWRLRLVDFGGAHLRESAMLERGKFVATPVYAPPPGLDPRSGGRGVEPDLWALGMTWCHLCVGHLPFAIDDPKARQAFHASGESVSIRRHRPELPAVLDEVVRDLTSAAVDERIDSARSARQILEKRVTLPRAPSSAREVALHGRDSLLDRVEERLEERGHVQLLAPPESGASACLRALAARAQARGRRVVSLEHARDLAALERFAAWPADGSGEAFELVSAWLSRLDGATTLLVDAHEEDPVVRSSEATARREPGGDSTIVRAFERLASSFPRGLQVVSVLRDLAGDDASSSIVLEPIATPAIRAIASDFFAVEEVSDELVRALEPLASRPGAVLRALSAAERAGCAPDFLGELVVPRDALSAIATLDSADDDRALSLEVLRLRASPIELSPPELATLHGGTPRTWSARLEAAASRGLVTRVESPDGERRYLARSRRGDPGIASPPPERAAGAASSAELAVAISVAELRCDRNERSLRGLLRACGRLEAEGRLATAWKVLAPELRSPIVHGRVHRVARLRAARLGLRLGHSHEVRALVRGLRSDDPVWFRTEALALRASSWIHDGRPRTAVRSLREARRERARAGATSTWRDVLWHVREMRATLDAGSGPIALRSLHEIREHPLLRAMLAGEEAPPGARRRAIVSLCELAAVESTHGDVERALRLLDLARDTASCSAVEPELRREPLRQLSVLHARLGRPREALAMFEELESLATLCGDRSAGLEALHNRALLTLRQGDTARAEQLFRRARRESESLGPHRHTAAVWLGLAGVLRERGRPLEALRLYRRVLRLGEGARSGDRALAHNNLGEIYQSYGRLDASLRERERAVEIARRLGARFLLGVALRNLGAIRLAREERDAARSALDEASALVSSGETLGPNTRFVGGVEVYRAQLVADDGRVSALRGALATCRAVGDRTYTVDAMLSLLAELLARGRRGFATRWLSAGTAIPPRSRVFAESLRCRTVASWPGDATQLARLLDEAERSGERWPVLVALRQALREGNLPRDLAARLSSWRASLESRLGLDTSSTATPGAPPTERGIDRSNLEPRRLDAGRRNRRGDLLRSLATVADGTVETLPIEPLLQDVRAELEAAAVALWSPARTVRAEANRDETGPVEVGSDEGSLLDAARSTERLVSRADGLAVALSTRERPILLALAPGRSDARERFEELATLLTLAIREAEARAELISERERSDALRSELQRLQELGVGKNEIDTALLSRRQGLLEAMVGGPSGPREPVAASRALREVLAQLPRLSESDLPVLFLGESGVGKDRLARWSHFLSPRRHEPFLAEACALPPGLLEAELFGWVRGAFSGAESDHDGLFARVQGGTLYLDEIAELSVELQARLLRVLEERRVRRLGSTSWQPVDFRIVASSRATNVEELLERGLRRDLFYRLGGAVIEIPPLRERPDDIPALVREFVAEHAVRRRIGSVAIESEALERLARHDWPGNARELENAVRRALLEHPDELRARHLDLGTGSVRRVARNSTGSLDPREPVDFRAARDAFEREIIERALDRHAGNASHAARSLGLSRRYLGKLLEKHGLDLRRWKPAP